MRRIWMICPALFALTACLNFPIRSEDTRLNSFYNAPKVGPCAVLPDNNIWNTPVDTLPVDESSSAYVESIGADLRMFTDFGSGLKDGGLIGFPYMIVGDDTPKVRVNFEYAHESDHGEYPIPPNPLIEGGPDSNGDRHVILVDTDECKLYELFAAHPNPNGTWRAGSGAVHDLRSNRMRPRDWTSADAAGLPIFPGLVRYEEVAAGKIPHALRFTAKRTRKDFVWPARHHAGESFASHLPPLGQRFRLKASFDTKPFPRDVRVILETLKTYGMILADNGGNWGLSGAPSPEWDNDQLWRAFAKVKGSDFEAVDTSSLIAHPDWADISTVPNPAITVQ